MFSGTCAHLAFRRRADATSKGSSLLTWEALESNHSIAQGTRQSLIVPLFTPYIYRLTNTCTSYIRSLRAGFHNAVIVLRVPVALAFCLIYPCQCREMSYLTMPTAKSPRGGTTLPCSSTGGDKSSVATMYAMASQILASASAFPGHCRRIDHCPEPLSNSLWSHRLPKPKTKFLGSSSSCLARPQNRSGLNSSEFGYCSSSLVIALMYHVNVSCFCHKRPARNSGPNICYHSGICRDIKFSVLVVLDRSV